MEQTFLDEINERFADYPSYEQRVPRNVTETQPPVNNATFDGPPEHEELCDARTSEHVDGQPHEHTARAPLRSSRQGFLSRMLTFGKRGTSRRKRTGGRHKGTIKSLSKRLPTWFWDFMSLWAATGLLGILIVILAVFDGRALSQWHSKLTINTIASILAIGIIFTLMAPVSSALGQLKWVRFRFSGNQLEDFELIDGASRGPLGSLMLLFHLRLLRWIIVVVGAFITLAALAVPPSIQLLITTRTRPVATQGAFLPVATNFTAQDAGNGVNTIGPMTEAVYDGWSSALNRVFDVPTTCPTSNCTWALYQTLGICSHCTNVTEMITTIPLNVSGYPGAFMWALPNGHYLNETDQFKRIAREQQTTTLNVTTTVALYNIAKGNKAFDPSASQNYSLAYKDRGSILIDIIFMSSRSSVSPSRPFAAECVLQFCVKTMTATTNKGIFREVETSSFSDNSVAARSYWVGTTGQGPFQYSLTAPAPSGSAPAKTFNVGQTAQAQLSTWLMQQMTGQSLANIATELSTTDAAQAITQALSINDTAPFSLMTNIANSLTTNMRTVGNVTQTGVALQEELYFHIRWAWIALPVAVLLLAWTFTVTVSYVCWKKDVRVWKNSTSATLFHGLSEEARSAYWATLDEGDIDDAVKELVLKLECTDKGWRLVPVSEAG